MTMTVAVQLTSEAILEGFIGRACSKSKDDEFVKEVEAAGGINDYIDTHPVYRHLGKRHKTDAIACYFSDEMREELRHPRQVAERDKLITPEAEPWRDESVALQS